MLVRIRCRDRPLDRPQTIGYKGVNTPSVKDPAACFTGGNAELRILGGPG